MGRGKMIGYGHEAWVDLTSDGDALDFALRAVEWACGENADVGLARVPASTHSPTSLRRRDIQRAPLTQTIYLVSIVLWQNSGMDMIQEIMQR